MKKNNFIVFVLLAGSLLNVFSQTNSQKKVILISVKSDFKNAVVNYISFFYQQKKVLFSTADFKNLSGVDEKEWDAIIILSTIQKDKISDNVINFSKDKVLSKKIILANTADSGQWKKKQLDYDTITMASKKENIELFSKKIIEKIEKLIN